MLYPVFVLWQCKHSQLLGLNGCRVTHKAITQLLDFLGKTLYWVWARLGYGPDAHHRLSDVAPF